MTNLRSQKVGQIKNIFLITCSQSYLRSSLRVEIMKIMKIFVIFLTFESVLIEFFSLQSSSYSQLRSVPKLCSDIVSLSLSIIKDTALKLCLLKIEAILFSLTILQQFFVNCKWRIHFLIDKFVDVRLNAAFDKTFISRVSFHNINLPFCLCSTFSFGLRI